MLHTFDLSTGIIDNLDLMTWRAYEAILAKKIA